MNQSVIEYRETLELQTSQKIALRRFGGETEQMIDSYRDDAYRALIAHCDGKRAFTGGEFAYLASVGPFSPAFLVTEAQSDSGRKSRCWIVGRTRENGWRFKATEIK